MSQQEILDRVIANPGIRQAEFGTRGDAHHQIAQLVKKRCIRRELIRSPRNFYVLYPTGEGL